jgi:DMSO/TMAO reductase YedYZ molybdopterin-dependent catalytic subunit
MAEALHPQTQLAYGMNDEELPAGHGAPIRLRLARQLGYKNTKYLSRITLTDDMAKANDPARRGPWYGGI